MFTVPRLEYTPPASIPSLQIPTDESLSIFVGPITDDRGVPAQSLDYVLTKSALGDKYFLPVPLAEEVRKFIIAELKRSGITVVSQKSDATGYFEATITGFRFVVEWAGALTANFSMNAKLYASGDPRPLWASTLKGSGATVQIFGTKRISNVTSQALSQAIGSLGENQSFVDGINQLSAPSTTLASRQGSGLYSPLKRGPEADATGIYSLEKEITFNVLDQVVVDPKAGTLTLLGHHDRRYSSRRIPYLQHLAVLMKHSRPQFNLNWTAASEQSIDGLFKKLDNTREMVRLAEGPFLDDNGTVTASGRVMLPLLGVSPTLSGGKPGYLGVRTEASGSTPWIKISSVAPNSPAARAGLKAGEIIDSINGDFTYHPLEFDHRILILGAGSKVTLRIFSSEGEQNPVITLGAASGDPWKNLDRFDMTSLIFRSAGQSKQADVVAALGSYLLRLMDTKQGMNSVLAVFHTLGLSDTYRENFKLSSSGTITSLEAETRMDRAMCRELDRTFGFNGAMLQAFNSTLNRGGIPAVGVEAVFAEMDRQIHVPLRSAMKTVMRRNDEIQFTPEMLQSTFGIRPVVRPEYIDLPANSELARVMLMADYLGKSLINMPELQKKIPQYQTQYAHQQTNAAEWEHLSNELRLWISVDNIDLLQSEDGNILELKDVQMKFNLEDFRKRGARPGSYGKLLTSLYDDFSMHYPELHELREAAKLAAVARWLKVRHTWIKFPAEGLIHWSGPKELPGFVFLTWSPKSELIIASVMGGVSLVIDDGVIPVDASVVDLRPDQLVIAPEDGLGILSRIVQPETKSSVPRPIGWVTKGKIGGKSVTAVTITVNGRLRDSLTEVQWGKDIEDNALVLWKTSDLEGAEKAYREQLIQLEHDPQRQAGIKLLLAQVLHEKGEDTAAIMLIEEATQIAPDHPLVHLMHAKALDEANDRQGAIKALKKFLSIQPDNTAAVELLAEMQSTQGRDRIKSGFKEILSENVDRQRPGKLIPFEDMIPEKHYGGAVSTSVEPGEDVKSSVIGKLKAIEGASGKAAVTGDKERAREGAGLGLDTHIKGKPLEMPEVPAVQGAPADETQDYIVPENFKEHKNIVDLANEFNEKNKVIREYEKELGEIKKAEKYLSEKSNERTAQWKAEIEEKIATVKEEKKLVDKKLQKEVKLLSFSIKIPETKKDGDSQIQEGTEDSGKGDDSLEKRTIEESGKVGPLPAE